MKGSIIKNPTYHLNGEWIVEKKCDKDGTWLIRRMHSNAFSYITDEELNKVLLPASYEYPSWIVCECGCDKINWHFHSSWCPKYFKESSRQK